MINVDFQIEPIATAILYLIQNRAGSMFDTVEIRSSPFYNGREKGICLVATSRFDSPAFPNQLNVVFGEDRRSDRLYVMSWFSAPTLNPPSIRDLPESAYNGRKGFGPDDVVLVADEAISQIRDFLD